MLCAVSAQGAGDTSDKRSLSGNPISRAPRSNGKNQITSTGGWNYTYNPTGERIRKDSANNTVFTEFIYLAANPSRSTTKWATGQTIFSPSSKRIAKATGTISARHPV